jgi:hypothetical protein
MGSENLVTQSVAESILLETGPGPSLMSPSGRGPGSSSCCSAIVSSSICGSNVLGSTETSLISDKMAPRNARNGIVEPSILIIGE